MRSFIVFATIVVFYATLASSALGKNGLPTLDSAPVLHFTLTRRGGSFAPTVLGQDCVNLTYLSTELERTEARFNLTQRQVEGNKLVRKAKDAPGGNSQESGLMGHIGDDGIW